MLIAARRLETTMPKPSAAIFAATRTTCIRVNQHALRLAQFAATIRKLERLGSREEPLIGTPPTAGSRTSITQELQGRSLMSEPGDKPQV